MSVRSPLPARIVAVSALVLMAACGTDDASTTQAEPTAPTPTETSATPTGVATTDAEPEVTAEDPAGNADGAPDLTAAAATLGVTVEELEAALGGPPPDLEAAAAALGVSVADLEAVLPPPGDQRAGAGPGGGEPAVIPDAALDAAANGIDITDAILTSQSVNCADYVALYSSDVTDISQGTEYEGGTSITVTDDGCLVESNNVPNHDFADNSSDFATVMAAVGNTLIIPRSPQVAAEPTALTQGSYNAVMLNGVVLDILSAGCYDPDSPQADADGNTAIGCPYTDPWLLDPLGTVHKFGADEHNAHTQPDGRYHYHASPNALYEDAPTDGGSPVIGFAADGFPIYGPYFVDPETGAVRGAISGYTLIEGARPSGDGEPGGTYTGIYNNDYEYQATGDLDECNGMTIDGNYGYYVTSTYPWVVKCLTGTPDPSFAK